LAHLTSNRARRLFFHLSKAIFPIFSVYLAPFPKM
jgi:hypothetical protein